MFILPLTLGMYVKLIRIDNVRLDVTTAILVIFSDIEQQDSTGIV